MIHVSVFRCFLLRNSKIAKKKKSCGFRCDNSKKHPWKPLVLNKQWRLLKRLAYCDSISYITTGEYLFIERRAKNNIEVVSMEKTFLAKVWSDFFSILLNVSLTAFTFSECVWSIFHYFSSNIRMWESSSRISSEIKQKKKEGEQEVTLTVTKPSK